MGVSHVDGQMNEKRKGERLPGETTAGLMLPGHLEFASAGARVGRQGWVREATSEPTRVSFPEVGADVSCTREGSAVSLLSPV